MNGKHFPRLAINGTEAKLLGKSPGLQISYGEPMRIPKHNHSCTVHCQWRRRPDDSRRLLRGGPIFLFQGGAGDIFLSPAPLLDISPSSKSPVSVPPHGVHTPCLEFKDLPLLGSLLPSPVSTLHLSLHSSQTSPLSTTPHSSPHTRPLLSPPPRPRSFPLLAKPHPSFNTKQKSPPTQSLL